jgi:hypothetical protein
MRALLFLLGASTAIVFGCWDDPYEFPSPIPIPASVRATCGNELGLFPVIQGSFLNYARMGKETGEPRELVSLLIDQLMDGMGDLDEDAAVRCREAVLETYY